MSESLSYRLFIAAVPQESIRRQLELLQAPLRRLPTPVKWVRSEQIHLTLEFLGDVNVSRIPALERDLQNQLEVLQPVEVSVGGLGCFPTPNRPKVVWVGLGEQGDTLRRLKRHVVDACAELHTDSKSFQAHLTLGRVRQEASGADIQPLSRLIRESSPSLQCAWKIEEVALIRSILRPSGPDYTTLCSVPLTGPL